MKVCIIQPKYSTDYQKIDDYFNLNPENADDFISKDNKSSGLSYEKYAKSIKQYDLNYFDIIVVDGRVRNACIKQAIPHIKKGGYLIVDNSDRSYYLSEFNFLNNKNEWENQLENGFWTYSLDAIWTGLKDAYKKPIVPKSVIHSKANPSLSYGFAFDKDGYVIPKGASLCDSKIVSAILCNYSAIRQEAWGNFEKDIWYLLEEFD